MTNEDINFYDKDVENKYRFKSEKELMYRTTRVSSSDNVIKRLVFHVESDTSKWIGEVIDNHFILSNMDDREIDNIINLDSFRLNEPIYEDKDDLILTITSNRRKYRVSSYSIEELSTFQKLIKSKRSFNGEYDIIYENSKYMKVIRKADGNTFVAFIASKENNKQLKRNINFIKRVKSPFIIKYIDHFEDDNHTILIVENFESDLSNFLNLHASNMP